MEILRDSLLESVTSKVSDYRRREIPPIDIPHVDRWTRQFDQQGQVPILRELNHLLERSYLSYERVRRSLTIILESTNILGQISADRLRSIHFLDIQRKGSSQRDLLKLLDDISQERHEISIYECGMSNPNTYIYLDDCIFSGNTLIYDIIPWLPNAQEGTTLHVICLGLYRDGLNYAHERLKSDLKLKNIQIRFWYLDRVFNQYERFWPEIFTDNSHVDRYVERVQTTAKEKGWRARLFRPNGAVPEETLFSSPIDRGIIESAFSRAGAYIVSLPQRPNDSMRPLGYEYLESLGFGAMFVTYRNISNNCPLALWWGDPRFPTSHPFSKWYPLFPRKANEFSRNMSTLDIFDF